MSTPILRSKRTQSALLIGIILLVIIVPFIFFGERIEQAAVEWSVSLGASGLVAAVISLLALDILLPVPSSIVSLIAGKTLGFWPAALAIWMGMTLGCYVGVLVGRGVLGPVAGAFGVEVPVDQPSQAFARWGWASLILMRPVPVLAEASVLYAAVRRYPTQRIMLCSAIANAPIALFYAYAGERLLDGVPMWALLAIMVMCVAPFAVRQAFRSTEETGA